MININEGDIDNCLIMIIMIMKSVIMIIKEIIIAWMNKREKINWSVLERGREREREREN